MTLSVLDITEQSEQMQQELMCILDGFDDEIVTSACQVIVDRCYILVQKVIAEQARR